MKAKLILGSLLLPIITASPVYAAPLGERLENRQNRIENRQEIRQDRREDRQQNRQERRDQIAENHADRLTKNFTAHYERLNSIIAKIQSRIDAAKDKDVTTAQTKLTEAKTKLAEAKTLGDSAVAKFKAIDPAKWEEQNEALKDARDTAQKARTAYVDTLRLANESFKLLKQAVSK